ncbi:LOW QUALITY PROTEIN: hypothetical protein PHMEG_0008059 [Phytophthora megakarya]|uniref:Cleavage induced protein n=1 Tax=Phytophthora megakarya TaxID=4795 RepID=A0A225WM37_9STRA|nr:LOW QUALITY PROTEIN: hypothetical protein PHMEG_0008059 [Phytophthora megakarya]
MTVPTTVTTCHDIDPFETKSSSEGAECVLTAPTNPPAFLEQLQHRHLGALRIRKELLYFNGEQELVMVMNNYGVSIPKSSPEAVMHNGTKRFQIDLEKQFAHSKPMRRSNLSFPQLIRLVRGETPHGSRPNNALEVPDHLACWKHYKYKEDCRELGWGPTKLDKRFSQTDKPSVKPRSLRKGQDDDRYLILDISLLPQLDEFTCSPFDAVPKNEAPLEKEASALHDRSGPKEESVNKQGQGGLSAYRIIIQWSSYSSLTRTNDSPRHHWVGRGAIVRLYKTLRPLASVQSRKVSQRFDGEAWCDKHAGIEVDVGSRLMEASIALRTAMVTVLGPYARNNETFTPWFTEGRALGFHWNLVKMMLSMLVDKLNNLLGSSRHVATWVRTVAPFYQRIAALARSTSRFYPTSISEEVRDVLRRFVAILRTDRLNSVPLSCFVDSQQPDYHIFMDASDRVHYDRCIKNISKSDSTWRRGGKLRVLAFPLSTDSVLTAVS